MLQSPLAGDSWTEADVLLAHAAEIDENLSRCPCGCGGYADVTTGSDGAHVVRTFYCDARRVMEQDAKENPERDPGVVPYPALAESVPTRPVIPMG